MYGNVLVTGAAGFIGSHLVQKQLSLGRRVRALDLRRPSVQWDSKAAAVETVIGDIADSALQEEAVKDTDLVFHLASAHLSVNVPEETYWRVNAHCLRGLLECCRNAGVKRFVHVSSVGVYGKIDRPPADEDYPCRPELLYERTKYEGEVRVRRFFERTGFPIVIVRPAWVYGPGCPRSSKLFKAIEKRRFFFAGDGRNLRHCVYIDDVVDGLELAATREVAVGKVYILADARPVTVAELIEEIASVLNVESPRLHVPLWLLEVIGLFLETAYFPLGKEPPFSRRTMRFFTNNTAFDISRAKNDLSFIPRYDLSHGLRTYAEWFKKHCTLGENREHRTKPAERRQVQSVGKDI